MGGGGGGGRGELQGSLCVLLLVLFCIVALLADRSGSIFGFLQSLRILDVFAVSLCNTNKSLVVGFYHRILDCPL